MSDLPEVPDFLGKYARVETVSRIIAAAQEQKQNYHVEMVVNGRTLDDHIGNDEKLPTYREQLAVLDKGIEDVAAENTDIAEELVAAALKSRRRIELDVSAG
jgi:hypothetical protein